LPCNNKPSPLIWPVCSCAPGSSCFGGTCKTFCEQGNDCSDTEVSIVTKHRQCLSCCDALYLIGLPQQPGRRLMRVTPLQPLPMPGSLRLGSVSLLPLATTPIHYTTVATISMPATWLTCAVAHVCCARSCGAGSVCSNGTCVDSCNSIKCQSYEFCQSGRCQDKCAMMRLVIVAFILA
jgi:hypothetical protein